jgi:hypothetical protein
MRIVQIKPHYFRAFGDSPPITFDNSLSIYYGANGTGKSSLAEAIEWLIYGFTKRRKKGDEYSKIEYRGSYVNSNCPQGNSPFVEADFIFGDGSTHTLRREIPLTPGGLPRDNESKFFCDGTPLEAISSLGIEVTEAHCPVIVQHGIQDFIHSRPIERYRVISEALGLNDLVVFKDVLAKAKNALRNNPSSPIAQARELLPALCDQLRIAKLDEIAARWEVSAINLTEDFSAIANRARELAGKECQDFNELRNALGIRRAEEIAKLFDISPYRPSQELGHFRKTAIVAIARAKEINADVKTHSEILQAASANAEQAKIVDFLRQGLSLIDQDHPEQCPFCENASLSDARLAVIQQNIKDESTRESAKESFNTSCEELGRSLYDLREAVNAMKVSSLDDANFERLLQLSPRADAQLRTFASQNKAVTQLHDSILSKLKSHIFTAENIKSKLDEPEAFEIQLAELQNAPSELEKQLSEFHDGITSYLDSISLFQATLSASLSNQETIALFDALLRLLESAAHISLIATNSDIDRQLLEAQHSLEYYILGKQNEAVQSREADILEWYSRLSPNPDVRFSGLQPGRNEIALKAEAFGQELNAAASLSQSQLNCLGLSIYIPCVTAPDSPFEFLVFDDPVQAMDDDHHEAFIVNVIPQLIDHVDCQVIVLTHIKETADRIRDCNFTRNYTYSKFDRLEASGPVISENIAIPDDMKHVRRLAEGNDEIRLIAVDRIRVICERIMREVYFRANGSYMPPERNTASSMVPLFGQVPNVTPQMITDIQDTINWSNPAHHTQPGYSPPPSANIRPHIERLQNMINSLGLNT